MILLPCLPCLSVPSIGETQSVLQLCLVCLSVCLSRSVNDG